MYTCKLEPPVSQRFCQQTYGASRGCLCDCTSVKDDEELDISNFMLVSIVKPGWFMF